jgi:hypothetical protein
MVKLSTYAKLLMSESMTLYIKNEDYTRYDTMWELSVYLQRFAYQILETLPQDQKNYFQRNRPAEFLTIDGNTDMNAKSGILNLYYSGYTKETLDKILKIVEHELNKLHIQYEQFKIEKSKMFKCDVIRIPILNIPHEYSGAPELNMSNRNAYHIFKNILQFDPDDEAASAFTFDAHELKQRIETILKHDPEWIKNNQINKNDSDWPEDERGEPQNFENPHDDIANKIFGGGSARIIQMGLSDEDIRQRLYKILEITNWAIEHGKNYMYAT